MHGKGLVLLLWDKGGGGDCAPPQVAPRARREQISFKIWKVESEPLFS